MNAAQNILIVEDDAAIAMIVTEALRDEADTIAVVGSIAERDAALTRGLPDLLITDVMLPDGDGLATMPADVLAAKIPVIVLSAQNTLDTAVRAADLGSYDYLPKPFDLGELIASVRAALNQPKYPAKQAGTTRDDAASSHGMVGRAPAMQAVYRTIARLASNDLAVLILGESGTGKEVVARAVHATGLRRAGPFVAINMAAIPRELIEAELFGHEKGAFTGAINRKAGRFEQASGGTLFLDEIGDMPIDAQTRLLRVLQSGEFSRVGGHAALRADVRVVAATHRDMAQLVAEGRFREDLFYRLNVIPMTLPPLRERRSDIPALIDHFLTEGARAGLPDRQIADAALVRLCAHDWPGNVRELANVVQRLAVLSRDTLVAEADVLSIMADGDGEFIVSDKPDRASLVSDAVEAWADEGLAKAVSSDQLHAQFLDVGEAALFRTVLRKTGGNQLAAARLLGINRNTLRKRLTQLQIAPEQD